MQKERGKSHFKTFVYTQTSGNYETDINDDKARRPGFAGRPLKISTLGGNQIKPGRRA